MIILEDVLCGDVELCFVILTSVSIILSSPSMTKG